MGTRGVVAGRVVDIRPHPNGQRIWLADVDLGAGTTVQIVFGGKPVVHPGSMVPVAPPGSRLPDGTKMRRRRYRGEISTGMLCSLAELGWDMSVTDRVAVLSDSDGLKPGMSLDDRAASWQSLIDNPRTDRGSGVLRALRSTPIFSGVWRPHKRGALRPDAQAKR